MTSDNTRLQNWLAYAVYFHRFRVIDDEAVQDEAWVVLVDNRRSWPDSDRGLYRSCFRT